MLVPSHQEEFSASSPARPGSQLTGVVDTPTARLGCYVLADWLPVELVMAVLQRTDARQMVRPLLGQHRQFLVLDDIGHLQVTMQSTGNTTLLWPLVQTTVEDLL